MKKGILLLFIEVILRNTTVWTGPIVGEVFEKNTFRFLVVDIAADITDVFRHSQ